MSRQPATNRLSEPGNTAFSTGEAKPSDDTQKKPLSLEKSLERYLTELKRAKTSESTLRNYRSDIGQFLEFFRSQTGKDFAGTAMDVLAVEKFAQDQKKKGMAEATIRRKLVSIHRFSSWLSQTNTARPPANTPSSVPSPSKKSPGQYLIDISIERILSQYLTTLKYNSISDATIRNYRSDIKQFAYFARAKTLATLLTLNNLKQFALAQKQKGLKMTSIQRKLASITQFAIWAYRKKLITEDPAQWVSLALDSIFSPSGDNPVVITQPSPEEVVVLQQKQKKRAAGLIWPAIALLLLLFGSTVGLYLIRTVQDLRQQAYVSSTQQTITQSSQTVDTAMILALLEGSHSIPFRGRLHRENGEQVIGATTASFQLLDGPSENAKVVWESGACQVGTDLEGFFNITLGGDDGEGTDGSDCGTPLSSDMFYGESNLWLSTTIGGEQLALYPVKTVSYSEDSALLSGYPIGDPVVRESVLFMNEQGEILFADEPIFNAPEGDITLAGENILLSTEGRGNIISDSAIVAPVGSFQAGVAIGTTGAYITTSDNNLVFYDPETGAKTLADLALVGGSGGGTTVINESFWTQAGSAISYTGGNVGIGTSTTEQALTVGGNIQLGTTDGDRYIYFDNGGANNAGIRYNAGSDKIQFSHDGSTWADLGAATGVTSVTNSDGTLTISPNSGGVVASLNLNNPNTWSALQTFGSLTANGTITFNGLSAGVDNTVLLLNSSNQVVTAEIDARVWGTSLVDGLGTTGSLAYWADPNTLAATDVTSFLTAGDNIAITGTTNATISLEDDIDLTALRASSNAGLSLYDDGSNLALFVEDGGFVGIGTNAPEQILTAEGNLQLGTTDGTRYIYFDNGTGTNSGFRYNSTTNEMEYSNDGATWISFDNLGAVTSVGNSDGSLTVSPTTGNVIASLNPAHANTWTALQTFNNQYTDFAEYLRHQGDNDTFIQFGDDSITLAVGGETLLTFIEDGVQDIVTLGDGGDVDINLNNNMFVRGSDGFVGIGTSSPEQLLTVDGNIQLGTTDGDRYIYFDNGTTDNAGIRYNTISNQIEFSNNGTTWMAFADLENAVDSVSNLDGTLTISPTTGNVLASLNLANANTWTALQTFGDLTSTGTVTLSGISGGTDNTVLLLNASNQIVSDEIDSRVWGTSLVDGSGTAGYVTYWSDADTLAAEQYLSTTRGGLGADVTAAGAGELLYSTGTTTYDSLTAGASGQLLVSGGAGTPSWNNIASLLTAGNDITLTGTTNVTVALEDDIDVSAVRASSVNGLGLYDDGGTLGLFVADQGNVGIGTGTPDAKLHVSVGNQNQNIKFSAGNGFTTGLDLFSGTQYSQIMQETTGELSLKNRNEDENIQFVINDGGVLTTAMILQGSTGNLGVGVASPEQSITAGGNLQLGTTDGDRYIYFDNGTSDNGGFRYNSTTNEMEYSDDGTTWFAFSNFATGGVTTVSNADGTLTISPTSGNVIASLNLANANTWSALQTFGDLTSTGTVTLSGVVGGTDNTVLLLNSSNQIVSDEIDSRVWGTSLVDGSGTTGYVTYWSDSDTLAAEQYLSTARGGLGASVTAAGAGELLYSTGTTAYDSLAAGASGQLLVSGGAGAPSWSNIASLLTAGDDIDITGTTNATIALEDDIDLTSLRASSASGFSIYDDGNTLALFVQDGGKVGVGTSSPEELLTVNGNIQLGITDSDRYIYFDNGTGNNAGFRYNSATDQVEFSNDGLAWDTFAPASGVVTSITNADGTLTISPTTGAVIASLNLANANTWSALQTFGDLTSTGTVTLSGISGGTDNTVLLLNSSNQIVSDEIDSRVWGTSLVDGSGTASYVTYWSDSDTLAAEQYLSTARGGLGANVTAAGAGELLYSTSTTAYDSLAAGSSGQLLLSGGAGAPSWSNIASILTAGDDIDITGTTNATISLEDDIDLTSLRASSASGLSIYDDGSNLALFVEDGGAVGVGTASPEELLTVDGNIQLGITDGTRGLFFDNGTSDNSGIRYNSTTNEVEYSDDGTTWVAFDDLTNAVTSVSNADGTLTISPTTGAVIASLNLANANTWSALQTFGDLTSTGTVTLSGISGGTDNTVLLLNSSNQIVSDEIDSRVWGTSLVDGSGTAGYVTYWSDSDTLAAEQYLSTARGGLGANVTAAGAGELLYSTSTTAYDSLAAGSSGQLLLSGGAGAPSWSNIASLLTAGDDIDITGTTNATIALEDDIDLTSLRASSASGLSIYDDGSTLALFVEDGGAVGVGTASPEELLTVNGNIQLGITDSDRYIYFDNGTGNNAGFRYNATTDEMEYSNDGTSWVPFDDLGGVTSVSNADGTLTISPTTGAVIASLNLANANTWSALQTFGDLTSTGTVTLSGISGGTDNTVLLLNSSNQIVSDEIDSRVWGTSLVDGSGTAGYVTYWSDADTLAAEQYLATSRGGLGANVTTAGAGEILYSTSTTAYDSLAAGASGQLLVSGGAGAPSWSNIASLLTAGDDIDITGTTNATIALEDDIDLTSLRASSASGLSIYDDGSNLALFVEDGGAVGVGTASPEELLTVNGNIQLGVTDGTRAIFFDNGATDNSGIRYNATADQLEYSDDGTTWVAFDSLTNAVSSVSNVDGTLTISPTTGNVIASLNLANANTWSALQTFGDLTSTGTVTLSGVSGGTDNTVLLLNSSNQIVSDEIDSRVWGSSLVDGSGTAGYVTYWSDSDTLAAEQYLSVARGGLGANVTAAGAGEILYSTSTTAYDSLAAGTSGQLLVSGGAGAPSWSNIASLLTAGDDIDITGTTNATIALEDDIDLTSLRASSASGLSIYDDGSTLALFVEDGGAVGIGTASPEEILTVNGNIQLGIADGTNYIYFDNGTSDNAGFRYNATSDQMEFSNDGTNWIAFSSLTSGLVTSVSNSDGTLTISPTTGAVIASLNLANANSWSATQSFTDINVSGTIDLGTNTIADGDFTGDWDFNSGDLSGVGDLAAAGTITLSGLGTGTTNDILVQEADNTIGTRSIDSRVWGSSLVDGSGTTNYVAYWSDSNTLTAEQYLATSRGGLGGNITAAGAGEILYSTSTTAYDSLAAGGSGQLLVSGGAGAPSWSNIASLLTAGDDIDITGTTNATIALEDDVDLTSLRASSAAGLSLYDDGSNLALFVEDGGAVGIGTNSPEEILTVGGNIQLGTTDATRYIYFDNGTGNNSGFRYNSATDEMEYSDDGTNWIAFSSISGGGSVLSVSNSDGTLTISPTTGNVVASLNLNNANSWTATQSFTDINVSGTIDLGANTITDGDFNGNWDFNSGNLSGIGDLTASGTINLSGLGTGTTNTVLVQEAGNAIATRTIDARVWGASLVDGSGTTNYVTYWSDADTLAAEQYLSTGRGGLGADVTAAGAGELLYSTGTTTYDSLAAGTSGQLLISGGAGAPSWSNIASLLTAGDDIDITGTTNATIALEDDIDLTALRASSAAGLSVYDAGSNLALFVEDGGAVGVGTNAPEELLTIDGNLQLGTTDATRYIYFDNGTANNAGFRYNSTSGEMEYSDDGTTWLAFSGLGGSTSNFFTNSGTVASGSYLDVSHNQGTSNVVTTAFIYNGTNWVEIDDLGRIAHNIFDPNLVGWYKAEEASGDLDNAEGTSARDLIDQGAPTYEQTGKINYAVELDGIDDFFCTGSGSTCADNDSFDFGADSFTIGGWFKHDGIATDPDYMMVKYSDEASLDLGNGADGAITISTDTNINTATSISGRSCSDGGDAVNYSVTALTSTTATLESSPSSGCLSPGDEVLLINLRGTNSNVANVGNYETLRVASVISNTVTFTDSKVNNYGDDGGDGSIGLAATDHAVMLQRVPNYTTVTISGSGTDFVPSAWVQPTGSANNGAGEGGVMFFRATGTVSVGSGATINANSLGYLGGSTRGGGEAFCGPGGGPHSATGAGGGGATTGVAGGIGLCGGGGGGGTNNGAGGAGSASRGGSGGGGGRGLGASGWTGGNGGGGGYGTAGGTGALVGTAGSTNQSGNGGTPTTTQGGGGGGGGTYGSANLTQLFYGSGGGAGGLNNASGGADGGRGGGIVMISANTISVSGTVASNGSNGGVGSASGGTGGSGGGGAGGSIKLLADTVSLGSNIVASAGSGGANGGHAPGHGGVGRIAVEYVTSVTGSTSPSYTGTQVSAASGGYKLYMNPAGNFVFGIDDDQNSFPEDSAATATDSYDDGQWHHVVAVKKGDEHIKLYVDGEEVASDYNIAAINSLSNDNPFYLGVDFDGSSNPWDGGFDEPFVYSRALSPGEVEELYHSNSRFRIEIPDNNTVRLYNDSDGTAELKLNVITDSSSSGPVNYWNLSGVDLNYTAGNVGIGTSSPQAMLDVNGRIHATDMWTGGQIELNALGSGDRYAYIDFHGDDTYSDFGLRIIRNNTGANAASNINHRGTGALSLLTYEAAPIEFWTNGAKRVTISSGGDMNIGTTNTNPAVNNAVGTTIGAAGYVSANYSNGPSGVFGRTNDGNILQFYSAGVLQGSISVAGSTVSYNAFTGSHYGLLSGSANRGELVSFTGQNTRSNEHPDSEVIYGITRTAEENDPKVLGSYFTLQEPLQPRSNANPDLVMAVGNGDMWVADFGSNIKRGDYLISSSLAGHARKDPETHEKTYIVARAAEDVDWSAVSDTINGKKHKKISVTFESFKTVRDMKLSLSDAGELDIQETAPGVYQVTDSSGRGLVDQLGAFTRLMAGNVQAGAVSARQVVADNITVAGQSLAAYIQGIVDQTIASLPDDAFGGDSELLSPLPGEDVTIQLRETAEGDESVLQITNEDDEAVLTIDQRGNVSALGKLTASEIESTGQSRLGELLVTGDATVSGTLTAEAVEAEVVEAETVVAETVQAENLDAVSSRLEYLEGQIAQFEEVKATTAEVTNLSVGTLTAETINNFDQMIATAFQQPSLLSTILNTAPQVDPFDGFDLSASNAQALNLELADLSLEVDDVVISPSAVFINDYLKVNGAGYIGGSLGVGQNLVVGDGIQIGNGALAYRPTDPEANATFYIQPERTGMLSFLGGLMTLSADGQIVIEGDLRVAGAVDIAGDTRVGGSLLTNLLRPLDPNRPFQIQLAEEASQSGQVNNSRFEIIDELGAPVATISASGQASFAGGLGVDTGSIETTEPGVFMTTKTAGRAHFSPGLTEVTIKSDKITADTLIYVTPLGSTNNQVIYVKSQVAENPNTLIKEGKFVVALDFPLTTTTEFNWWMVQ